MDQDNFTIMIVRQSGKIRTVKMGRRSVAYLLLAMVSLVCAFAGLLYGYVELHRERRDLLALMDRQTPPAMPAPSALLGIAQATAAEGAVDSVAVAAVPEPVAEAGAPDFRETSTPDEITSDKVSVQELAVRETGEPNTYRVSFRLKNDDGTETIKGFVAVVMAGRSGRRTVYWSFPDTDVGTQGELVDWRKGDWFSIRWQKQVVGEIRVSGTKPVAPRLAVYVYSVDGELLVKKHYGPAVAANT